MTPAVFFNELYNNFALYLCCLLGTAVIYFFLLRRTLFSIYDPITLNFVISVFGASVVFFLFGTGNISAFYFISYLLTQLAFFVGFLIVKPVRLPEVITTNQIRAVGKVSDSNQLKILFLLSLGLLLVGQIMSYNFSGIPILLESRIQIYYNQGLLPSILNKLLPVIRIIVVYCSAHYLLVYRRFTHIKLAAVVGMVLVTVVYLLSGSKSNILEAVMIIYTYFFFGHRFLNRDNLLRLVRSFKVLFVASVLLLIFILTSKFKEQNPLFYLMYRYVQSGDAYFYAYPNATIEQIRSSNPVVAFFPGIARLVLGKNEQEIPSLGVELFQAVNKLDVIDGPNARHNVFGLAYFGPILSVLYSFLLGLLLGSARTRLYRKLPPNVIGGLVYTLIIMSVAAVETDANLCISSLVGVIVFGLPLLAVSTIIVRSVMPRHKLSLIHPND